MNENPNRISWQQMFMEIAVIASKRSCDPKTQVGACLVKDNCVIGIGYNGAPRGFGLDFDWAKEDKYDYVIHAEINAITNSQAIGANVTGADVYVTLSPCHNCMKTLAQNRVKRVFYLEEYKDFELASKIARYSGMELIRLPWPVSQEGFEKDKMNHTKKGMMP